MYIYVYIFKHICFYEHAYQKMQGLLSKHYLYYYIITYSFQMT